MRRISCFILFLGATGAALASPAITAGVDGSSFIVRATNSEDRGYNCHIDYTLNYVQYDVPGSQNYHDDFFVKAGTNNGVVVFNQTTWAASTLTASGVHWSCN